MKRLLVGLAVACCMPAPAVQARAIQERLLVLPFKPGTTATDGYDQASISVQYQFINCAGEIHIAYNVVGASIVIGQNYWLEGVRYPSTLAGRPQNSTIRFAGRVTQGGVLVGNFADGLAGPALGGGCFSGQSQRVGLLRNYMQPGATPQSIEAFLNGLVLNAESPPPLKSGALESVIRSRRAAELQAAANAERAKAEAARKLETDRLAAQTTARAAAAVAQSQAQAPSRPPPAGFPGPAQASANAQAQALAAAQARALAQQQAKAALVAQGERARQEANNRQWEANAADQARFNAAQAQNEQTAQQLGQFAQQVGGALEQWQDARNARKAAELNAQIEATQRALAGKCVANNDWVPKQRLRFGVEVEGYLSTASCAEGGGFYDSYLLVVPKPAKIRVVQKATIGGLYGALSIHRKGQQIAYTSTYDHATTFFRTNELSPDLAAGEYIVRVKSAYVGKGGAYTLSVSGGPAAVSLAGPARPKGDVNGLGQAMIDAASEFDFITPADAAKVASWRHTFTSPDWTPRKTVAVVPSGLRPAGLSIQCGVLASSAPVATAVTYLKPGETSKQGIASYAGETVNCDPHGVGMITYADGSRWIGEVAQMSQSMLPRPAGLGEFTGVDGISRTLRAVPDNSWVGWQVATILVPRPPPVKSKLPAVKQPGAKPRGRRIAKPAARKN